MQPQPKFSPPKYLKEGVLILLIALTVLSFVPPRFIEYADNRFIRSIPFIITFSVIPGLVMIALTLYQGVFKVYFLACGFLAFLIIATASEMYRYSAKSNELAVNGVWTKAIVIDKKEKKSRRGVYWQIKCSFNANNHRFETQYEIDSKNTYKKGDTIEINYNKEYPKMYRLKMVY